VRPPQPGRGPSGVGAAALAALALAALAFALTVKAGRRAPRPPTGPAPIARAPAAATATGTTQGQLSVNASGAATYTVPITVPPGTAGASPELALAYASRTPDDLLGASWHLTGLPSIERCGATIVDDGFRGGVNYGAGDRFCLAGLGLADPRLQPIDSSQATYFTPGATYRPAKEAWIRVVASSSTCGGGPCSFTVTLRDGTALALGTTADSAVAAVPATTAAPPPAGAIRTWLVASRTDPSGNAILYTYTQAPPQADGSTLTSTGNAVPLRIDYTARVAPTAPTMAPMRSVQFLYQPRNDPSTSNQGGATTSSTALLAAVQTCIATAAGASVTGQPCTGGSLQLVRQTSLSYQQNPQTGQSQLAAIQECGADGSCLPATTFSWTDGPDGETGVGIPDLGLGSNQGWVADFNGDGLTDLLSFEVPTACNGDPATSSGALYLGGASGFALPGQCVSVPFSTAEQVLPGDYNGDGLADVLLLDGAQSGLYLYAAGAGFPANGLSLDLSQLGQSVGVGDINGDGLADLLTWDATSAIAWLATGSGFNAQAAANGVNAAQGFTAVADVTGDGLADLVSAAATSGTIYPSTGAVLGAGIPLSSLDLGDTTWLGDFTGDGLPDLLSTDAVDLALMVGNGAGFEPSITLSGQGVDGASAWPGDFNGDGRLDLYSAGATSSTILVAGASASCAASGAAGPCFTAVTAPAQNLTTNATWLGDFNGDGAADLYAPATGGGSDTIFFASVGGQVVTTDAAPDLLTGVVDGLGGQITLSYRPLTDPTVYTPQAAASTQLLDGLLAFQSLAYAPLGPVQVPLYPTIELQDPSYVVASQTRASSAGVAVGAYSYTTTYLYQQSLVNLVGRGWLGFATVTAADLALGSQHTTNLSQDYPFDGSATSSATCAVLSPLASCPSSGAGVLATSTSTYRCTDTLAERPCQINNSSFVAGATTIAQVVQRETLDVDLTYGSQVREVREHDRFGNPIWVARMGDVANGPHPVYTCASYQNDTTAWHLGYLERRKVSTNRDCSDLATWKPRGDRRLGWVQYDQRRLVTAELHWDADHQQWLGTGYRYDDLGNQIDDATLAGAIPVEVPGTTYHTAYDPVYRSFPIARTTPVPDPSDPHSAALTTHFAYDARFGVRIASAEPDGTITNQCVDGYGRLAVRQGPPPAGTAVEPSCLGTATYPYLERRFADNTALVTLDTIAWQTSDGAVTRQHQLRTAWSSPAWTATTTVLDGLGRTARAITQDDSGAQVYVDAAFQTAELPGQTSLPYLAGSTPQWITQQFDGLARPLTLVEPYQAPDGTVSTKTTTWSYTAPNTITETRLDPGGQSYVVTSQFSWFFDQRKTVRRTVVSDGGATTTFDYDPLGALVSASAPPPAPGSAGVRDQVVLDSLGRRRSMTESDTGALHFTYDPLGRLIERRDALGQRIELAYDALGREVRRTARRAGLVVDEVTTRWDHLPGEAGRPDLAGRVAAIAIADGQAPRLSYRFGYDAYGDVARSEVRLPGVPGLESLVYTATYDPQRRELTRRYPDTEGTVVTTTWGPLSGHRLVQSVATRAAPTPTPYATYGGYTPGQLPTTVALGNGTTEAWSYDVAGAPLGRVVTAAGGAVAQATALGWDPLGNPTGLLDCTFAGNASASLCQAIGVSGAGTADASQTFRYQALRLAEATGAFAADGGRRTSRYRYDQAGNLVAQDELSHTYDGHRVVGTSRGATPIMAARYDANGNLCVRTGGATTPPAQCPAPTAAPTGATVYTYDPYDRMVGVWRDGAAVETYAYDDEGNRVARTRWVGGAVAETIYSPTFDHQIAVFSDGRKPEHRVYLPGVQPRAAVVAGAGVKGGGAAQTFHADLAGSTAAVSDAAGAVTPLAYTPWGQLVGAPPASAAVRTVLFQGQQLDDTGLYSFGARYYDSGVTRFLSADAFTGADTYGQDALNRYAFVQNRPTVLADPSGDTPIGILLLVFQAIFDVILPEDVAATSFAIRSADAIDRAVGSDAAAERGLEAEARRRLAQAAVQGRTVSAEDLAWAAANRLRQGAAQGQRAKISVAITNDSVFVDVSGAMNIGDMLDQRTTAPELQRRFGRVRQAARDDFRVNLGKGRAVSENSFETWSIGNCAEFRVCNRVLLAGQNLSDIRELYTIDLRSWSTAPRCKNCQLLLREFDSDVVTSDPPNPQLWPRRPRWPKGSAQKAFERALRPRRAGP
jgi:RHS repeat-associated protein